MNICYNIVDEITSQYYSFLCDSVKLKDKYDYDPELNKVNYLLLFASHCDSELKLNAIENNLKYLCYNCIDIIFIISSDCKYKNDVRTICEKYKNITFVEKENDNLLDFGKFVHGLTTVNVNKYDYIIFTNDSIYLHSYINHFFNYIFHSNKDIVGYNDSSEIIYHYQSYLFAVKKDCINVFIDNINLKIKTIQFKDQFDVIREFELQMKSWFNSSDCFLKIGDINKNKNIYFSNDEIYLLLRKYNLLPISKLKRFIFHTLPSHLT